jgi:PD-(D/E)XK nuclease superfamily
MTNDELTKFFSTHAWIDNSLIGVLRGCKRKAFWHVIGPNANYDAPLINRGLAITVGDGADFGSCFHAGVARYYNTWGQVDEPTRRIFASRAFAEEWGQHFPTERIQSKHRLDNGLDILDQYFDKYLDEDPLFQPVEAEMGFAVPLSTALGTVYNVGRIDGIFKRLSDSTYWPRETKTCSGDPDKRLAQLKFDNQPVSYVASIRKVLPDLNITGFLGDVIQVKTRTDAKSFCRNYFTIDEQQCRDWEAQLVFDIEDWYTRVDKAKEIGINAFTQDTTRCFEYGRCAFYDLCDYGISELDKFNLSEWHPLLKRTPKRIEIL